jgi:glycosyltransferase involved in cell wall biosynthesis
MGPAGVIHRTTQDFPTASAGNIRAIRILAILDDTRISGKVKPVLTFARYAREDKSALRPLEISMLTFSRTEREPELVGLLRDEDFVIDLVRERHRFDFGVFPQLRAIIDRRQPDVLWTHGSKTHFLVRAAGLHRRKAWVAFHHGYTTTSLAWRLYGELDRWSLHGADCVMTACAAFAADLNARIGISSERLKVYRSPIARSASMADRENSAAYRRELGLPPHARVVLTVGRLSREKGHADLLRAMVHVRRMCDFQTVLLVAGDGPERARLEELCTRLGIADSVRILGYQQNVTACYEIADVFALPSYSEGSPNVLLEAMDAGLPIVATAVGGVGEMIRNGEHGLLVPAGDVEGIARSVVALLNDAELRLALTNAARDSLAAYSPEEYYVNMRSLFEEVVSS